MYQNELVVCLKKERENERRKMKESTKRKVKKSNSEEERQRGMQKQRQIMNERFKTRKGVE